ncbi:hypothetical protein [Streptomyces sp. NPDC020362]|uniref:hypothetical protein n=1 Tax=unclassified Streptomyces TaxID=2593676 RepID=UPI003403B6C5
MVMPQDIVFHLPCAPDVSADADGARRRSLDWCRSQGLVTHPVDRERFLRWDIAGLMAAWVSQAAGDRLDLTVDAVVVATFLDDQFDGPLAARPSRVAAACRAPTSRARPHLHRTANRRSPSRRHPPVVGPHTSHPMPPDRHRHSVAPASAAGLIVTVRHSDRATVL